MESPVISRDVLARYAGDAALEVDGVTALTREAVGISDDGDIDVHVELEWGAKTEDVARSVQGRVAEYVERMASTRVGRVDVVVERVGAPPAKR